MTNPVLHLSEIQDYMLTAVNIDKITENIAEQSFSQEHPVPQRAKQPPVATPAPTVSRLVPRFKDTLFWCFYIVHCGQTEYEMASRQGFKEEKCLKIDLVERVRDKKDLLKAHKWKRSQIEDELVNQPTISITTFMCICAAFDYNVVIVDGRKLYQYMSNARLDESHIIVLHDDKFGIEVCDKSLVSSRVEQLRTTLWNIDNINKPLKAASSYKYRELKDIYERLGLSSVGDKKLCKRDLYKGIQANI